MPTRGAGSTPPRGAGHRRDAKPPWQHIRGGDRLRGAERHRNSRLAAVGSRCWVLPANLTDRTRCCVDACLARLDQTRAFVPHSERLVCSQRSGCFSPADPHERELQSPRAANRQRHHRRTTPINGSCQARRVLETDACRRTRGSLAGSAAHASSPQLGMSAPYPVRDILLATYLTGIATPTPEWAFFITPLEACVDGLLGVRRGATRTSGAPYPRRVAAA